MKSNETRLGAWLGAGLMACAWTVWSAAPAWSQANAATTAAPILQIPLGARAVGMGAAFTGLADDLSSLYYNPGGLPTLNSAQASFMYMSGLADHNIEALAMGLPLPFSGLIGNGYSTLGASLLLSQDGSIVVNRTNPDGSFLDSQTLNAGGDMVVGLSYGERLLSTPWDTPHGTLHFDQFMGVTGKLVRSTLAQQYSASAGAVDVGYLLRIPETGWSAGASLLNAGTRMTFISYGDPLPMTIRAGAAYGFSRPGLQDLTFASDLQYLYYERLWRANAGVEYSMFERFSARAGYQFNENIAGLTVGFGFRWQSFVLDYAWALSDAINDMHRISFTYRFGRTGAAERERPKARNIGTEPEKPEIQGIRGENQKILNMPPSSRPANREGAPGWIY